MEGKAHMAIGAALGAALAQPYTQATPYEWLIVPLAAFTAFMAAGLPDVLDSEHASGRDPVGLSWSSIQRDARKARRKSIFENLLLLPRALVALVVDLVAKIIPHRGPTHWLVTWLGLSALAVTGAALLHWPLLLAYAFGAGYLSHLLADALTVSGVPLLWPFSDRKIHLLPGLLRFRFNSPVQWLYVLGVWGVTLFVWRGELTHAAALGTAALLAR